jgi:hypothetical protein
MRTGGLAVLFAGVEFLVIVVIFAAIMLRRRR